MRTEPESLRLTVRRILEKVWPHQRVGKLEHLPAKSENEGIYEDIDGLAPKDEGQRGLPLRAMSLLLCMGQITTSTGVDTDRDVYSNHILGDEHFCQLGNLFAVVASFYAAALSVLGAILLIVEKCSPYSGLQRVSSAPLRLPSRLLVNN